MNYITEFIKEEMNAFNRIDLTVRMIGDLENSKKMEFAITW